MMATSTPMVGERLLGAVKGHAGIALGVGITLILAGVLAICAPFVAGVSVMVMIGAMLMIGGVALCLLAFRMRVFGPGLPFLLMGGLMIVTGLYMAGQPVAALLSMTVLLSIYLIVSGIVEFFSGIGARPDQGWGWIVASGVVTLLLGIMLWRQFPLSGVWAIGTLFGIKLLMTGFSMTSIGAAVRQGVRKIEGALKP